MLRTTGGSFGWFFSGPGAQQDAVGQIRRLAEMQAELAAVKLVFAGMPPLRRWMTGWAGAKGDNGGRWLMTSPLPAALQQLGRTWSRGRLPD
jgi:hypothetical protein